MIPESLDLDKYVDWLFKLSVDLEAIESKRPERLAYAAYKLSCRAINQGLQSNKSKELAEVFNREAKRLENVNYERYKGYIAQQLNLDYFLPIAEERDLINHLRSDYLAYSIESFQDKRQSWFLPESELIEQELVGLSYHYEQYYRHGEPIQMGRTGEPRQGVVINLVKDFNAYDYAYYLRCLLEPTEPATVEAVNAPNAANLNHTISSKPSHKTLVMFAHYRQKSGGLPSFGSISGNRKTDAKDFAEGEGLSGETFYKTLNGTYKQVSLDILTNDEVLLLRDMLKRVGDAEAIKLFEKEIVMKKGQRKG